MPANKPTSPTQLLAILRRHRVFRHLGDAARAELAGRFVTERHDAGALVADGIWSVLQRVKLEKIQDALLADSRERLAQARSVARAEGREHAED